MHVARASFAVLALCVHASASDWVVRATRLTSAPIARGDFTYLYNAAMWLDRDGIRLLERVQSAPAQQPYTVGPSKIAYASLMVDCAHGIPCRVNTTLATESSIVFRPTAAYEKCGTEDPRIEWYAGLYYLFYTAYDCETARLALATTTDPSNATAWQRHGPILEGAKWSKSGAVIFRSSPPHYLLWGDSTDDPGLRWATSVDGLRWETQDGVFLPIREDQFDSKLVEAGPSPILLRSGHLFFVYNSARAGYPSVKPGYALQYNVAYAVLDPADPVQVVARSQEPLLSPTLDWEIGNTTAFLVPNVVFVEGMVPCPQQLRQDLLVPSDADAFLIVYGAADTTLGIALIVVGSGGLLKGM